MNISFPSPKESPCRRRGMLLLLVLSMLTLFVLMGALAVVIATRSRESARAFADANGGGSSAPIVAESMLDEALLTLIRGSKDPSVNTLLANDSLLKDMYGTQEKGRFVDEPYDSFDGSNQFLTHVTLDASGRVTGVPRPAFAARGTECQVDNDGDGVADSVWLTGILQPITLPDGNRLDFRAAYLVLDLDGRVNVNAHGKRSDAPAAANGETGPADVDASSLLTPAVWNLLMERTGGQLLTGSVSPGDQWRPAPPISSPVDGRFGALKDANGGAECDTYKLRLDLEAARPGAIANAATQNPFTLGELERVLRQFDADASTLPPRLAGILHDRAERARMRITTDNWETPGDRMDIKWEADNAGVVDERADWAKLWPRVVAAGAPEGEAKQWVANLLDFRDMDKAETTFEGGLKGVEPTKQSIVIPGKWDRGFFESYAALLAVPKGTAAEWKQRVDDGQPLVSLVREYPKILEAVMVRSLFESTVAVDPAREPARVNVNTCDGEVWKALLGANKPNPFATASDGTGSAAKQTAEILLNVPLVFSDPNYDVRFIDHDVANRLANVSTVRSHVFAVWITLEVKRSDNPDQPTYHRLFAIVDRSIPAMFTGATEGQNTNVRNTIRLQRFVN